MRSAESPRYQGRITTWKDDQGFGFITPNGGGAAVFLHIKSFSGRARRPEGNEIVTYDLSVNERGQPRAENVAYVRAWNERHTSVQTGWISLVLAAVFPAIVAISVLAGKLPPLVFVFYLGISTLAFVTYARDKAAARSRRWRISEKTLHLLGLAGGWPGALLAQRIFRHKSKKQAFQTTFWITVFFSCLAFGWLLSPSGSAMLRMILGAP